MSSIEMVEKTGSFIFLLAILHTFIAPLIIKFSQRYPKGSSLKSLMHLLGEIEIVFGLWAAVFFIYFALRVNIHESLLYFENLNFTEPLFVFAIMVVASTKPILYAAEILIERMSLIIKKTIPFVPVTLIDLFLLMTLGPLAGSLITEPAGITVTALLLYKMIQHHDEKLLYSLLALLFVNVSIGGALTSFAAPPILMVAAKWGWGVSDVFTLFGVKAMVAIFINTSLFTFLHNKKIISNCRPFSEVPNPEKIPYWVIALHLAGLFLLISVSHYPHVLTGIFIFILGLTSVTKKFQEPLKLKPSLLVAFFLAGIVTFGPLQSWWLTPLIQSVQGEVLFVIATILTSITDNAALTYLGSQVPNLSDSAKYFLVAGSLAGGGLTLIANAPNAAGFTILQNKFSSSLNPIKLFIAALLPTLIVALIFGIF